MDQDTYDTIASFDDFSAAVSHENYLLTERVIKGEGRVKRLTDTIERQLSVHEAQKARIEMLESALAFSEGRVSELAAALERIAHFVRVERVLTQTMPAGETKDPNATEQNVAVAALMHVGAAE